jgi:hypothetical protein
MAHLADRSHPHLASKYDKSESNNLPGGYAHGPPRSPSPTPSEIEDSKRGVVDWKKLFNWRTYAKTQYIRMSSSSLRLSRYHGLELTAADVAWFLAGIVCIVLVALMTIYHKEIVHWLKPVADWMHE